MRLTGEFVLRIRGYFNRLLENDGVEFDNALGEVSIKKINISGQGCVLLQQRILSNWTSNFDSFLRPGTF